MADLAVIVASTQGGLYAVAQDGGLQLVEGTEQPFETLTTYSDPRSTKAGVIHYEGGGWVAIGAF